MHGKQKKTLGAIFKDPVSGTIVWADIESLLIAWAARSSKEAVPVFASTTTAMSPVSIDLIPPRRPKRYQVRDAREFLMQIGVTP